MILIDRFEEKRWSRPVPAVRASSSRGERMPYYISTGGRIIVPDLDFFRADIPIPGLG